jgi:hypothetical protein
MQKLRDRWSFTFVGEKKHGAAGGRAVEMQLRRRLPTMPFWKTIGGCRTKIPFKCILREFGGNAAASPARPGWQIFTLWSLTRQNTRSYFSL